MAFPLYFILIPYSLFIFIWAIFSLIGFYHLFTFGFKNFTTFMSSFIYLAASFLLLFISYRFILEINWLERVLIFPDAFLPIF